MEIKYGANIETEAVCNTLHRLVNQIYKLLPNREEGLDWVKPLYTITEEIAGMDEVLIGKHDILFPLLCKLEGLTKLDKEEDFIFFRRTIFECLNLVNALLERCQDQTI